MSTSSILISNELAILALLSRPQLALPQQQELRQRIQSGVDKALLRQLFEQHKVWGCAYSNVVKYCHDLIPIEQLEYLEEKYQQGVKCNRLSLQQFFQITYAFKQANINIKTLKGIPLAQHLYHDIAKRHFKDIDLLIQEKDLTLSNQLLNQLGYRCEAMEILPASIMPVYFSVHKDLTYCNNTGVTLELHLRLSDYDSQLSEQLTYSIFSAAQKNWDQYEEFIYLSWHGTNTLYHRLKWLCDLALFIEQQSLDFPELYRKATMVSKCRAVTTSLVLCHQLYNTKLPPEAIEYFNNDKLCRKLVNKCLAQLELHRPNPLLVSLQTILCPILFIETHKERTAALLLRFKVNYADLKYLPILPSWLHFVYYFARPFTFIWRKVIRLNDKAITPQ
ncbi:nucleotidyltransferase family protein [Photobacterium kasasachensis]|uniref:nucleotidyltransferase family protein n=1 Tax=Photobacterium kasasachensis TaxID=2910240 RepID=UPI003D0CEB9D